MEELKDGSAKGTSEESFQYREFHCKWIEDVQNPNADETSKGDPDNWKGDTDDEQIDFHYSLIPIISEYESNMKKRRIMRLFRMWDMAGIMDEFATHSLESAHYRISINFDLTGRMGFIMNKIVVKMSSSSSRHLVASMQEKLNWIYSHVLQAGLTEALVPPSILCEGFPCVVIDTSSDINGRFQRAKVVKIVERKEGTVVLCELIDKGVMRSFYLNELFIMVRKFTEVPSPILTVRLRGMKRFVGSPKFGMVAHTTLLKYSSYLQMRCANVDGQMEATISWRGMMETINDVILRSLCEYDSRDVTDLRNCVQGAKFESIVINDVRSDGRIWVKPVSRISTAIEDALEMVTKNMERYKLLPKRHDTVYIGKHPVEETLLRCKIVAGAPANWTDEKLLGGSATVKWIDHGDEGFIKLRDLIPASVVSSILVFVDPLAVEFRLTNVQKLSCKAGRDIMALLPSNRNVTVCIISQACKQKEATIHPAEVDVITCLQATPKPQSLSAYLIGKKLAVPMKAPGIFKRRTTLVPSGLSVIQSKYTCIEWAAERVHRYERESIVVGDRIKFCVELVGTGTYRIRPWHGREVSRIMQSFLATMCEELPWVKAERSTVTEVAPWGQFCVAKKDGKFIRVKIIGQHREQYGGGRGMFQKTEAGPRVKVLMIDTARIDTISVSSLWRLFPSPLVLQLGPQAVVAALEDPTSLRSLSSSKSHTQPNGQLKVGPKYTAIVDCIREYDESGRGLFILSDVKEEKKATTNIRLPAVADCDEK